MIKIDNELDFRSIAPRVRDALDVAAGATHRLRRSWDQSRGTPVFTVEGRYTSRGWTEWTQGFVYGNALLLFDATGDRTLLEYGREATVERMAAHVSHIGVHDHGFNNISTYGNLLRLRKEGRLPERESGNLPSRVEPAGAAAAGTDFAGTGSAGAGSAAATDPSSPAAAGPGSPGGSRSGARPLSETGPLSGRGPRSERADSEADLYALALKVSGAIQAARWTELPDGLGYIHSFNGPHSLFADTIRSLRSLAAAHRLGHVLMGEQDEKISLLRRLLQHAETTARYNVYFGKGRDRFDVAGRVVHESIFNTVSGAYRCPSTQQGYSPFSTWTRGHAWILCGFAEELEYLSTLTDADVAACGLAYFPNLASVTSRFEEVARVTADFAIENFPIDGVPYWDTGAPGLAELGNFQNRRADPFNAFEPVDSSAAAIAAQGFLRLGEYLGRGTEDGKRYTGAGLTIARTILSDPYLAREPEHEGVLLHSVYHHPNGWDHVRKGQRVPNGESCMWGDYHAIELAAYIDRLARGDRPYPAFFNVT